MTDMRTRLIAAIALLIVGAWLCSFDAGVVRPVKAQLSTTGAGCATASCGGGGFTPSCSQSSTFLAAASGVTLTADKTNYDTLICGLVSDGEWNFDVLYIFAAPTQSNAALINLANPGTFNGTTNGTVSFSAYSGYTGDGSTFYIDTGFNPTTATSPNFVQNSANIGAYDLTNRTSGGNQWLSGGGSGDNLAVLSFGSFSAAINSATTMADTNTAGTTQGAWNLTRITSSTENIYRNSAETTADTAADTSQAPGNGNIIFFSLFTGSDFTTDQMAAVWIGKGLSNVNSCKINNRINTYMASLASPINVYTNSAC